MAPSLSTAEGAYEHAAYRLRAACTLVERHLPNPESGEEILAIPPLRPRQKQNLDKNSDKVIAVSYTHLTLPTNREV